MGNGQVLQRIRSSRMETDMISIRRNWFTQLWSGINDKIFWVSHSDKDPRPERASGSRPKNLMSQFKSRDRKKSKSKSSQEERIFFLLRGGSVLLFYSDL
jgi:hypothetical protein